MQKSNEVFSKRQHNYNFNTLIAACMEALNALSAQDHKDVWTEGYFILLAILEPIIPHICWELSEEKFGRANFCEIAIDSSAFISEECTFAITINGKKRAEISVPKDLTNDELLALGKKAVAKWLDNVEIKKEIIVPNKLINFVVKAC